MESININIDNFEGPFDLLLKLIKMNKMDIMEISINEITEQYMNVLRKMEEINLEIASEFFLVAATLIEIKSRELLPRKKDEGDEIPSKEILLKKLKEYEFFKDKAHIFMGLYKEEDILVTRLPMTIEEEVNIEVVLPKNFTPEKFFMLYMELLDRQREKINTTTVIDKKIPIDRFKVEDKIVELEELLKNENTVSFGKLINASSGRAEAIVYFLAILELVRNHTVSIYQEEKGGNLLIENRK
ncbi:MAG: segregation/condensation protein A [Clostridiaceae bacterium]